MVGKCVGGNYTWGPGGGGLLETPPPPSGARPPQRLGGQGQQLQAFSEDTPPTPPPGVLKTEWIKLQGSGERACSSSKGSASGTALS